MAWKITRLTPAWENAIQNAPRRQCFRTLANYCWGALNNGNFTLDQIDPVKTEKIRIFKIRKRTTGQNAKLCQLSPEFRMFSKKS